MYDNQSFQCNLRSEDKYCSGKNRYCKEEERLYKEGDKGNGLIFDVSESKYKTRGGATKLTAQASAFARRILSACIQNETSARGLAAETAARITGKKNGEDTSLTFIENATFDETEYQISNNKKFNKIQYRKMQSER